MIQQLRTCYNKAYSCLQFDYRLFYSWDYDVSVSFPPFLSSSQTEHPHPGFALPTPWSLWSLTPPCPSQSPTPGKHVEPQDVLQTSAVWCLSTVSLRRHQPLQLLSPAGPHTSAIPPSLLSPKTLPLLLHPALTLPRSARPYPEALGTPPMQTCPFFNCICLLWEMRAGESLPYSHHLAKPPTQVRITVTPSLLSLGWLSTSKESQNLHSWWSCLGIRLRVQFFLLLV